MAKVKGRDTKPEQLVRGELDCRVFRYQPAGIPGKPDFANRRRRIAIFIDGCFWHGCPDCYRPPASRLSYWVPKVIGNRERDKRVTRELRDAGWTVLRFWECAVVRDVQGVARAIRRASAQ